MAQKLTRSHFRKHGRFSGLFLILAAAGLAVLPSSHVRGDDKDLFKSGGGGKPSVMFLIDTSGSMTWGVEPGWITSYDNDPTALPGSADDPNSRLYLAKSAIWDVVQNEFPDDALLGFAHFSLGDGSTPLDDVEVTKKQWLYTRAEGTPDPPWFDELPFPAAGQPIRLGWFEANSTSDDPKVPKRTYGYSGSGSGTFNVKPYLAANVPGYYTGNTSGWWSGTNQGIRTQRDAFCKPLWHSAFPEFNSPNRADFLFQSGMNMDTFDIESIIRNDEQFRMDRLGFYVKLGRYYVPTMHVTRTTTGEYRIIFFERVGGSQYGDTNFGVKITYQKCVPNPADPGNYIPEIDGGGNPVSQSVTYTLEPLYTEDHLGRPLNGAMSTVPYGYNTLKMLKNGVNIDADCAGIAKNPLTPDPGNSFEWSTHDDPVSPARHDTAFDRGMFLPWDWIDHPDSTQTGPGFELSNKDYLLRRLAPNVYACKSNPALYGGECAVDSSGEYVPDFRIGKYFENTIHHLTQRHWLREPYLSLDTPPLMAGGDTPLVDSMTNLDEWLAEWLPVAKDSGAEIAECSDLFIVILSDGGDNCGSGDRVAAAGAAAQALVNTADANGYRLRVLPIGFAASAGNSANDLQAALQAIADQGGTGTGSVFNTAGADCEELTYVDANGVQQNLCGGVPVATSYEGLRAALSTAASVINSSTASFAGAAIPSAQADSAESIYLSEFKPLWDSPTWPGDLNAFVRPLPLRKVGSVWVPDTTTGAKCPNNPPLNDPARGCFSWSSQEALLQQAPNDADIVGTAPYTSAELRLGPGEDERRVYWSAPSVLRNGPISGSYAFEVPAERNLLLVDSDETSARNQSLYDGLGLDAGLTDLEKQEEASRIIRSNLVIKSAVDPENDTITHEWVHGDIFHSDPLVLSAPSSLRFTMHNTHANGEPCFTPSGAVNTDATGYRCFFRWHEHRRHVVMTGTNDGLFHLFDGARWEQVTFGGEEFGRYNTGTGHELLAYAPRLTMGRLADQASLASTHDYSVDGPVREGDVFIDPVHDGEPTDTERMWRTVVIGGFREGGAGYYALDLTQPDYLVTEEQPDGSYVADPDDGGSWLPRCLIDYDANECGPLPYGSVLWEFADLDASLSPRDDAEMVHGAGTSNGLPDLAPSWSAPTLARIRVKFGSTPTAPVEDRFVAVFGGGYDPSVPTERGNWIYMVDIETGHTIYKRDVDSAVPSEIAIVDLDLDGYHDVVYFGTVGGTLYKIDLSTTLEMTDDASRLGGQWLDDVSSAWDPYPLFYTGGRPIYYPPSVVLIAQTGRYAVAFGTGERDKLTVSNGEEGRFYVFIDDDFVPEVPPTIPVGGFTEANLMAIFNADDDPTSIAPPLLDTPSAGELAGYGMRLTVNERLLARPVTLSGLTFFNTYTSGVVAAGDGCGTTGLSKSYAMFIKNGDGVTPDPNSSDPTATTRYREIEGLATQAFVESSSTYDDPGTNEDGPSDALNDRLIAIRDAMREQMPSNCRFTNFTANVRAVRSDTGLEFMAAIPVCFAEGGWMER